MKVAFVANTSWYLKNFRSNTIENIASTSEVRCFFSRGDGDNALNQLGVTCNEFPLSPHGTNFFKEMVCFFFFFIGILKFRPDVVFSFNPKTNLYSLIVCWILRIQCIPNVSGVGAASQLPGLTGKIYRALVGYFYRRAGHVFFQNKDDHKYYIDNEWVVPARTEILPGSGIDLACFKPCKKTSGKFRFLMAVRLIKQKGVEEYLDAARIVLKNTNNCDFVLAGIKDSSSRAVDDRVLRDLEFEEGIDFLGHVKDIPSLLETVDCVVLPSYYPEGVPRNLIEAAASGKVVITTDTPGCREVVIEGGNGYLVEPRSVQQLVQAMQRVSSMRGDQLDNMKKSSRRLAETCFDEKLVGRVFSESAISSSSSWL